MSDDLVKQALAELGDVVRCRCHEAYTGRGMHDPDCQCDSADAVKAVSEEIDALQARVDELEKDLGCADAYQREWEQHCKTAEARVAELEAERKLDHENINLKADFIENTINQLAAAEARIEEAVETLRVGFKSCDPTKTAAAIILAIAQLEGHGE